MKSFLRTTLSIAIILSIVLSISSCKKDDGPNPKTAQAQKLSTTWIVNQVTNNSQDVTSQYTDFTLVIDELAYTTQNGGNPWPAFGTWNFKGDDLNLLIRDDGTEITVDELTDSSLILSFTYNTVVGGKTSGITGDFTFALIK